MRAFVVLSLIAVAATGCKRANDKFCDADDQCESGNCNTDTNACEAAIPDAGFDAAICGGDQDCDVPTSPICDDGSGMCRGCGSAGECLAKDPATPECEGSGRCVECLNSATCDTGTPICTDGACEQCTAHPDCAARDAALPKCAGDGTCVECTEHADCASGVCDRAANTCVDASAVIYVDPGGDNDPGCGDIGNKCRTIGFALGEVAVGRSTLSCASGSYGTVIADGVTATIVGPTDALVIPGFSDQAGMFMFNGSNITLDGLTFRGAFGDSSADGVNCSSSTLTAFQTVFTANEATGVDASNCTVTLDEVQVVNNNRNGLFLNGSDIRMHRSVVQGNDRGGVEVVDTAFDIVNNFIVLNGESDGSGSQFGGVRISLGGDEATMVLDFNTIAENSADDTASARGVICFANTTVTNNIVYGGSGSTTVVSGNCNWTYSDVEGGVAGDGNIDVDPMFVDIAADNYHIQDGSPCRNEGDENATLDIDFDGEERPSNGRHDMGADEVQ